MTRGQTYGYFPSRRASSPFDRYQFVLLGDRGTCVKCEQLAYGCYLKAERPTVEPRPVESQVQRHNHYTTRPQPAGACVQARYRQSISHLTFVPVQSQTCIVAASYMRIPAFTRAVNLRHPRHPKYVFQITSSLIDSSLLRNLLFMYRRWHRNPGRQPLSDKRQVFHKAV